MTVPIKDQLECARREVRMREGAYPRWVESGKMTKVQADRELARMRAIVATLDGLAEGARLL